MNINIYIGETTEYDKKQDVERRKVKSCLKSVSAFANGTSGSLLFGIADDDTLVGLKDAKEDTEFISQKIKERIAPMPHIRFIGSGYSRHWVVGEKESDHDRKLTKELKDKIASFDICKPYVWLLKLSEVDFNELEVCLNDIASVKGFPALVSPQFAVETIIYIAEWYKRKYQRGNSNPLVEKLNLEALWINAGINQKLYLYHDDKGDKRWLYSIYVLGGLAIKHELGRNDNMRFLKGLCRIYHGEDYTLENLDEASRAIAFRESIKRCHSLYEYMQNILNGQMPFDDEDLKNAASDVNLFVAVLKTANDEILKVKFRFEWVVTFSPDYTFMSRRLNVLLKPEEVGGGLHQYLRYDRVHLWGVPHPETQRHLYVYIRFCYNEKIIKPSTIDKPIITYLNHGLNDFVAFGVEKAYR